MRRVNAYLGRRPVLSAVVVLVALLLCTLLMPDMAIAALAGCVAVAAISVFQQRPSAAWMCLPGVGLTRFRPVRAMPRGNGPPVPLILRT